MKTTNFLRTVLMAGILASSIEVVAQGRGHDKGNGHHDQDRHESNARDYHHDQSNHHDRHDNYREFDRHHQQQPVYVYYHRPSPIVERRVVYHYNQPRYIYYRDYDVYFDNSRNVYISYSGRNWTISSSLPVCMNHVDVRRAGFTNVNYFYDDFQQRLEVRRAGGRMCSDW